MDSCHRSVDIASRPWRAFTMRIVAPSPQAISGLAAETSTTTPGHAVEPPSLVARSYLNVKSAHSAEPRHVARRCERLVVSGTGKVGNPYRTLVPVDATIQSVAMAVKSSSSQVLGDIGKRLAASDLRDDARRAHARR